MHPCMYVCLYVCMHVCMYVCMCVCVCMYVYIYIYIYIYTCMYIYVYISICICISNLHLYLHVHLHLHLQLQLQSTQQTTNGKVLRHECPFQNGPPRARYSGSNALSEPFYRGAGTPPKITSSESTQVHSTLSTASVLGATVYR